MSKSKTKYTAEQVVSAIKKHKMDVAFYPDDDLPWTAVCSGGIEGTGRTLESAVQSAATAQDAHDEELHEEQERRDQAEFVRLSHKYGTAV